MNVSKLVIDEFPYLVKANAELPSIIQQAPRPFGHARSATRTRLLLCGSALAVMGKLLSGTAPLRGRAGLELTIPPLDHRLAAEFWGISDPQLAVRVNAIVGGTPAYRREFVRNDTSRGLEDFDAWVIRTVLNPETRDSVTGSGIQPQLTAASSSSMPKNSMGLGSPEDASRTGGHRPPFGQALRIAGLRDSAGLRVPRDRGRAGTEDGDDALGRASAGMLAS